MPPAENAPPSGRWVVVVSARAKPLFEYLSRGLAGTRDIEVIVERRRGQRRTVLGAPAEERRRADRRTPRRIQRFPLIGYEIVRLGPAHAPPRPPRVDDLRAAPAGGARSA